MSSKPKNPNKSPRLRASAFRKALRDPMFNRENGTSYDPYSCHAIARAVPGLCLGCETLKFYQTVFSATEPGNQLGRQYPYLPASFQSACYPGVAGSLTHEQLFSTRIIALSLAALLVEDGFYVDESGELAQRKPAKKGVRK